MNLLGSFLTSWVAPSDSLKNQAIYIAIGAFVGVLISVLYAEGVVNRPRGKWWRLILALVVACGVTFLTSIGHKKWFEKRPAADERRSSIFNPEALAESIASRVLKDIARRDSIWTIRSRPSSGPPKPRMSPSPRLQLKSKAESLSREIFLFVKENHPNYISSSPPMSASEEEKTRLWREDGNRLIREFQKFQSEFSMRFSARIFSVLEELGEMGIEDPEIIKGYSYDTNTHTMKEIATRIGALAQKLD